MLRLLLVSIFFRYVHSTFNLFNSIQFSDFMFPSFSCTNLLFIYFLWTFLFDTVKIEFISICLSGFDTDYINKTKVNVNRNCYYIKSWNINSSLINCSHLFNVICWLFGAPDLNYSLKNVWNIVFSIPFLSFFDIFFLRFHLLRACASVFVAYGLGILIRKLF